jgi:hypothetical protein
MPEVEIGLSAVVGDEDLTVLERVHGARIDVDVGVELLVYDPETSISEEPSKRRCGDSFAEA